MSEKKKHALSLVHRSSDRVITIVSILRVLPRVAGEKIVKSTTEILQKHVLQTIGKAPFPILYLVTKVASLSSGGNEYFRLNEI
jgi:hypothetical protein